MIKQSSFSHPIEVRFRDLDGLGHINNVVYLSYTEQCRLKWYSARFALAEDHVQHRVPFILARSEIDYIRPGYLNESLTVATWLTKLGTKSFTMAYTIMSQSQGELAKAVAVLVWYDYDRNASVSIPERERAILAADLV